MAVLKYSLLRLALLLATGAVFWQIGLRGFVLLLVALLVSGVISVFALSKARDEVSTALVTRRQTIEQRLESAEDETDRETGREA